MLQAYIEKLKSLKKEVKGLEFRVKELKERPEALAALNSMLNHSSYFLMSVKNLSSMSLGEESIFTAVETETLEKLINETEVSLSFYTITGYFFFFYKIFIAKHMQMPELLSKSN